jgi:predicted nucleic acid-binding protein
MYALAAHPVWGKPSYEILKRLETGDDTGVASCICLTEVMAQPAAVSAELGEGAQIFMEGLEHLDYIPVDLEVAVVAGRLQAQSGSRLRTPDSLHLATAISQRADLFVTNDHGLLKLKLEGHTRVHLLGEPLPG